MLGEWARRSIFCLTTSTHYECLEPRTFPDRSPQTKGPLHFFTNFKIGQRDARGDAVGDAERTVGF